MDICFLMVLTLVNAKFRSPVLVQMSPASSNSRAISVCLVILEKFLTWFPLGPWSLFPYRGKLQFFATTKLKFVDIVVCIALWLCTVNLSAIYAYAIILCQWWNECALYYQWPLIFEFPSSGMNSDLQIFRVYSGQFSFSNNQSGWYKKVCQRV